MNKLKKLFGKDRDGEDSTTSSSHQQGYGDHTSSSSHQQGYGDNTSSSYDSPPQQQQRTSASHQAPQSQSYSTSQQAPPSQSYEQAPQMTQTSGTQYGSGNQAQTQGEEARAQGVLLTTNYGDITVILFREKCPKTCENFATLSDTGKYNNTIFHRIIPNFMIQGGDPTGTGRGGTSIWNQKFNDEFDNSLTHSAAGVLSMANSGPGTNGSQFFITLAPTPHLDGKHTVFGQVVNGMDVIERMGAARTDGSDRPLEDIMIVKAESFTV